ncbi:MAG: RnfABCDGE type electron transport complex subunit D [Oscillospiraceae bacterium]|nr:RnfABCDGE type electron transport complex subunit D [Oscillospiraceae bacterium]
MKSSPETTASGDNQQKRSAAFERRPRHIYGDQLLCLLALLVMAFIKSGSRSLGLAAVAVTVSVAVDMLCCRLTRKIYNPRDISTFTAGLCMSLMSPAVLPYGYIIFGCALAIGVKHIFGGKDNYIFNPTAVAFAFLIICYPGKMLLFPAAGEIQPLFGELIYTPTYGMENLLLRIGAFPALSPLDFLIGNFAGPIGTTHVLIIAVCGVCLLFRKSISPFVTVSCLSVIIIFRLLFPVYDDIIGGLVRELFGGYLLFALIFLANDPQTVPKTVFGKLYYGVLLGVFTILFRGSGEGVLKGKVEGWFIFALLITNTLSCRMDVTAERIYAGARRFTETLRERLSAYERFTEDAKAGRNADSLLYAGDLSVTMEIEISPSDYDMPPIDNKVIKINRKKRNVLTYVIEFAGSLREKARRKEKTSVSSNQTAALESGGQTVKSSFVFAAYKALYESIVKIVDVFFKAPAPESESESEPEPKPSAAPPRERIIARNRKDSVIITDFEEIAEDVAAFEAKIDAEIAAAEKIKAEKEAEEKARLEKEAEEQARIEREAEERARLKAEEKERLEKEAEEKAKLKAEQKAQAAVIAEEKARIKAEEKAKAAAEAEEKARIKAEEKERIAAEKESERLVSEKLREDALKFFAEISEKSDDSDKSEYL